MREINRGMCECINIKLIHLSSQVHAATESTEGTSVCSHTLPSLSHSCHNNQQTFTSSSGTLGEGFYSKSHREWLAAFVMIGCVKYNAMILLVSVTHNCK